MPRRSAGRRQTHERPGAQHNAAIGARIRMARRLRGVSQTELGARIGVTFQQVQKYERAGNTVSAGGLLEIARVLELPVTFFYDDCEGEPARGVAQLPSEDCARLAGRIAALPASIRLGMEGVVAELARARAPEGRSESGSPVTSSPMTMAAE